jgi:predicted nucleic acid-binding protein
VAGLAVLSTQVMQELANVALRKLRLPETLIRERLTFYRRFELVPTTPELILGALDLHFQHQLAYYDALIVQAAAFSGCQRLLTEDMQHGAVIRGVQIENPFVA